MKNKLVKTISSLAMAAVLVCTSASAQAAEAADTGSADTLSIESCAANIKRIYKENYPEQADVIDRIVDTLMYDEVFIGFFENKGTEAFQIIEDSLRDALDPKISLFTFEDDCYYTKYLIPNIKQIENNYCGIASLVMAMRGAGLIPYTLDSSVTDSLQREYADETGVYPNGPGIPMWNMEAFLQARFPKTTMGFTYKRKAFTADSADKIEDYLATALLVDTIPILRVDKPQQLSYYPNNYSSGAHYVVVDSVDLATGEVWIIDPHYDDSYFGRHKVTIDEIKSLTNTSMGLWMCVYTGTSDDPYIYK